MGLKIELRLIIFYFFNFLIKFDGDSKVMQSGIEISNKIAIIKNPIL